MKETVSIFIAVISTFFTVFGTISGIRIWFNRWHMSRGLGGVMDGNQFRMKGILFSARLLGRFNGRNASLKYCPPWHWKDGTFLAEVGCRIP